MKIPRIPKTTAEIISQIENIDKRINDLIEQKEDIYRINLEQFAKNTSANITTQIYSTLKPIAHTTPEINEKLYSIDSEIQILYLRKRYLEKLAQKNNTSSKSNKSDEPTSGTYGL